MRVPVVLVFEDTEIRHAFHHRTRVRCARRHHQRSHVVEVRVLFFFEVMVGGESGFSNATRGRRTWHRTQFSRLTPSPSMFDTSFGGSLCLGEVRMYRLWRTRGRPGPETRQRGFLLSPRLPGEYFDRRACWVDYTFRFKVDFNDDTVWLCVSEDIV